MGMKNKWHNKNSKEKVIYAQKSPSLVRDNKPSAATQLIAICCNSLSSPFNVGPTFISAGFYSIWLDRAPMTNREFQIRQKILRVCVTDEQRAVLHRHVYFGWRQLSSIFLRLWLSRRWQLPGRHERRYFFTNRMNLDYCCTIRLHASVFGLTAPKKVSTILKYSRSRSLFCFVVANRPAIFLVGAVQLGRLSKRWLLPETAWNTITFCLCS